MPQRVNIKGVGTVHFPDDMTPDEIQQAIERDVLPRASAEPPVESPSILARIGRGMMDMGQGYRQLELQATSREDRIDPIAANYGLDPIRKGVPQSVVDAYTRHVNNELELYDKGREAQGGGIDWARIGGNVAATAPLAAVGAPEALAARAGLGALQGAVIGGTQFAPSGTTEERLKNAGTGAVLGGALPVAASTAGTVGRVLPQAAAATARRIVGNRVVDAVKAPFNARWNQRLFNEVTPDGEITASGPEGFRQLAQRFTEAYETLWRGKIKLKSGEVMEGKDIEALDDMFRQDARNAAARGDRQAAEEFTARRETLRAALPDDVADELARLDKLYTDYSVLRRAGSYVSGGAQGQPFTPAQLLNASRAADRSAGKAATAQGRAPMQAQANSRLGGYSQQAANAYMNSPTVQYIVQSLRRGGKLAVPAALTQPENDED